MSDLISRQAAIDEAYSIVIDGEKYDVVQVETLMGLPSAQPQRKTGRWIPCSERLPDIKEHHVSEPCIVCCSNGAYAFAELQENIFGQVGWDCERDDEYHEAVGKVVAWQPLPEPYREGGS